MESDLEIAFGNHVKWAGLSEPDREHRFHPTRRWRFDFAWPGRLVAVEVEGGVWSRGRHVRGSGFEGDCQKYNTATAMGWRVFRVTASMLEDDPAGIMEMVGEALGEAAYEGARR